MPTRKQTNQTHHHHHHQNQEKRLGDVGNTTTHTGLVNSASLTKLLTELPICESLDFAN